MVIFSGHKCAVLMFRNIFFVCMPVCYRSFAWVQQLNRHKCVLDTGEVLEEQFCFCEICNEQYADLQHLKRHMNAQHPGVKLVRRQSAVVEQEITQPPLSQHSAVRSSVVKEELHDPL